MRSGLPMGRRRIHRLWRSWADRSTSGILSMLASAEEFVPYEGTTAAFTTERPQVNPAESRNSHRTMLRAKLMSSWSPRVLDQSNQDRALVGIGSGLVRTWFTHAGCSYDARFRRALRPRESSAAERQGNRVTHGGTKISISIPLRMPTEVMSTKFGSPSPSGSYAPIGIGGSPTDAKMT